MSRSALCATAASLGAAGAAGYDPAASAVVAALLAEGPGHCGITGAVGASGFVEYGEGFRRPVCGRSMSTNCSVSYRAIRCPEECPYLAPSSAFSCLLECVPADECSKSNPDRAFPNPANRLCSQCSVANCRRCVLSNRCGECHEGFVLSADGEQCAFQLNRQLHFEVVLNVVLGALALVLLLSVVWPLVFGRPPAWRQSLAAIRRAMRHRHMVKVQAWSLKGVPRQRYPLTVDVHNKHILGVGLSLFYNSLCFLLLVALLFTAVTFAVYRSSGLGSVLDHLEPRWSALLEGAAAAPRDAPALVVSPLQVCGDNSSSDVQAAILRFGDGSFYALGFLYAVLFPLSLAYGKWQQRHAFRFDSQNSTMSDYAVALRGLPPGATSEPALEAWLRGELRRALPRGGELQLRGVSICYDYVARAEEVGAMASRLTEWEELRRGIYGEGLATAAAEGRSPAQAREADGRTVRSWFEGGEGRMWSSGLAFAVFGRKADKYAVLQRQGEDPGFLRHPGAPGAAVEVADVQVEPVSVCWWHFGVARRRLVWNACWALARLLLTILAVQFALVYPFAKYIVMPFVRTGAAAAGSMFSVAGFLLGWVNMLTSIQIYFACTGIGFHWQDKRDSMIFWVNLLLTVLNTCFNVGVTVLTMVSRHNPDHQIVFLIRSVVEMGTQHFLARDIYLMMIPGTFFTGYLMCPLMAGALPYAWNMFLMKAIYVWGCLPRPLLRLLKLFLPWAPESLDHYSVRLAERGLEPVELGLPWDYAGNVVFPTVCCGTLLLVSPYVWKVFLGLSGWAAFCYAYFRYMHLRFFKAQHFTSRRLDARANLAWGLPLSVVAAAWCVWALRTGRLGAAAQLWQKWAMVAGSFLCSLLLWALCYSHLVAPMREDPGRRDAEDPGLDEVQARTLYSWFNCNPVYVLKCKYFFQDKDGKDLPDRRKGHPLACGEDSSQVRFFEIGRQHLFIKPERQRLVHVHENDITEFETWFELVVRLFGLLADPLGRKAAREALVGELLVPVDESQRGLLDATPSEHKSNGTT